MGADSANQLAKPGRKLAVLIGIDAYQHDIPALRNAVRDIETVGAVLRDLYGYELRFIRDAEASLAALRELFQVLPAELLTGDSLVLYFAGHGVAEELLDTADGPQGFLVPPMSRAELREAIEGPAAERVLFFDPPALCERLLDEVADTPGPLPLLSFVLSEMYRASLRRPRDRTRGADGTRLVTAGEDKTARVFDAADGRALLTLTGHTDAVISAQFSPDSQPRHHQPGEAAKVGVHDVPGLPLCLPLCAHCWRRRKSGRWAITSGNNASNFVRSTSADFSFVAKPQPPPGLPSSTK